MKTLYLIVKEHVGNVLYLVEVVVLPLVCIAVPKETKDIREQEHFCLLKVVDLYLTKS